jgi:hypothetical protein
VNAPARRAWRAARILVRSAIALLLFSQALALYFEPDAFTRMGYADGARRALALFECAAAALTLWPRTFVAGAAGLIATLAWAAGFHFGLHRGSSRLFLLMALLALLVAAEWADARRGSVA